MPDRARSADEKKQDGTSGESECAARQKTAEVVTSQLKYSTLWRELQALKPQKS
jgi:hypothetical protein